MRVLDVDYGKVGSPGVRSSLVEDIFALEPAVYATPPSTLWVNPSSYPTELAHHQIITMPYPIMAAAGDDGSDDGYPRVYPMIFGAQDESDMNTFGVWSDVVQPNAAVLRQRVAVGRETARAQFDVALIPEAETTINLLQIANLIGGAESVEENVFIYVGTAETGSEIMLIEEIDGANLTLRRGLFDTVPRSWPVGTALWLVATQSGAVDLTEHNANETVAYQFTPRTSKGELPLTEAPEITYTLTERPYLPFRPANVLVDGQSAPGYTITVTPPATGGSSASGYGKAYGRSYGGGGSASPIYDPENVTVEWANRNRLLEDTDIRRWDEGNVTPEIGQTTTIRVYDNDDGTLLQTYDGIDDTTFDIPMADVYGTEFLRIEVGSERDGFESLQAFSYVVRLIE